MHRASASSWLSVLKTTIPAIPGNPLNGPQSAIFPSSSAPLIAEFNGLGIPGLGEITDLNALVGAYINLAYTLPKIDTSIRIPSSNYPSNYNK